MKARKLITVFLSLILILSAIPINAEEMVLQNHCKEAAVSVIPASAGENAANIVDGDTATVWTSGSEAGAVTLMIDLNNIVAIGYIHITWSEAPKSYVVHTRSNADEREHTVYTVTDGAARTEDTLEFNAVTGRYIEIELTEPVGSSYGIAEIVARKAVDTMVSAAPVSYPGSGTEVPEGSALITGEFIGSETGWGENTATGRAAAFDGDINTFFDPPTSNSSTWCGIDAGEPMILTKIVIHPRDAQLARFFGATIEASNDPNFTSSETVTLWYSLAEADEWTWQVITEDDIRSKVNTGYRYFRYINYDNPGDVAEIELYGYAGEVQDTTDTSELQTTPSASDTESDKATESESNSASGEASTNNKDTSESTKPVTGEEDSNAGLFIGIAVAAVAVIAVVAVIVIKKKK